MYNEGKSVMPADKRKLTIIEELIVRGWITLSDTIRRSRELIKERRGQLQGLEDNLDILLADRRAINANLMTQGLLTHEETVANITPELLKSKAKEWGLD